MLARRQSAGDKLLQEIFDHPVTDTNRAYWRRMRPAA
jgi:hypothetical protein